MSGGHWDYIQYRINDIILRVSDDEEVKSYFGPNIISIVSGLGDILQNLVNEMDKHISGDIDIKDPNLFFQDKFNQVQDLYLNLKNNLCQLPQISTTNLTSTNSVWMLINTATNDTVATYKQRIKAEEHLKRIQIEEQKTKPHPVWANHSIDWSRSNYTIKELEITD